MIFSTRQIALISMFSALIVVISRLPGIPILGGPMQGGGSIELSVVIYPLIGLVLGPWIGFVTAILGNLIAWILPTSTMFGLLLIPAGALSAFISGCLSHRFVITNWKAASGILSILILLWYLTPVGVEAPLYPILHLTALGLILFFRDRISLYMHSTEQAQQILGSAICCYGSVLTDHMFGNLAWISSIGFVIPLQSIQDAMKSIGIVWLQLGIYVPDITLGDIFMFVLPISVLERVLYTAVATILVVGIIRVLGWSIISDTK
jgi:uncharacterized membrane protein